MITIMIRSLWSYVGDDGGRGEVHTVIGIDLGDESITTSSYKDEKSGARSWNGSRASFLKVFKPYSGPKGKWFGKKDV